MRRFFYLLLIAVLVAFGLFFGTLNNQPTPVDYFFVVTQWPLALSLMSFFLFGVLLGGLFAYLAMWLRARRRVRALKRQIRDENVNSERKEQVPVLTANE